MVRGRPAVSDDELAQRIDDDYEAKLEHAAQLLARVNARQATQSPTVGVNVNGLTRGVRVRDVHRALASALAGMVVSFGRDFFSGQDATLSIEEWFETVDAGIAALQGRIHELETQLGDDGSHAYVMTLAARVRDLEATARRPPAPAIDLRPQLDSLAATGQAIADSLDANPRAAGLTVRKIVHRDDDGLIARVDETRGRGVTIRKRVVRDDAGTIVAVEESTIVATVEETAE